MPLPSEIVLLPFPFTDLSAAWLMAEDFELGGLPKESIVRPDKVFTLNDALIVRRVGKLTPSGFERILEAVCQQLGCKKH